MSGEVTQLLEQCENGSAESLDELMSFVYGELRRKAAVALRRAGPSVTLQPTMLVHEAYISLVQQDQRNWANRRHFFAVAARLMRRVLLKHAERRGAVKRGGNVKVVTLVDAEGADPLSGVDLIDLDEVLSRLEKVDEFKHRIVELRFFSGLTVEEIAELEGVSDRTVRRAWNFAKSWISKELRA